MGKQANSARNRVCKICTKTIRHVTAAELREHAVGCAEDYATTSRLEALGLTRPKMAVESAELIGRLGGRR